MRCDHGQIRAVDRHSQQPAMISNDEAALLRVTQNEREKGDHSCQLCMYVCMNV